MNNEAYSANLIAEYIIRYSNLKNLDITNLRLQKLLYFLQAHYLSKFDKPLFKEDIEAWDYGPVVPDVYSTYRIFGGNPINLIGDNDSLYKLISDNDKKTIENIIEELSNINTYDMVKITHNQNPWINSYNRYINNVITKQSIKDYFGGINE